MITLHAKLWTKEIWVAKRKNVVKNEEGIDIEYFMPAEKFYFNYQPLSSEQSLQEYGERVSDVYRTIIPKATYEGQFHTGDRVYLSDENFTESELENLVNKDSDNEYCNHANYVINTVLIQNKMIRMDFLKRR